MTLDLGRLSGDMAEGAYSDARAARHPSLQRLVSGRFTFARVGDSCPCRCRYQYVGGGLIEVPEVRDAHRWALG
jgi:hypothetical protein